MIDITLQDARWAEYDLLNLARTGVESALNICSIDISKFDVSILGCDDARISELNAEFRGKPTPTNVLSWPAFELANSGGSPRKPKAVFVPESLGDIAISLDTCQREALEAHKDFNQHVTHLVVHGCLHLLGYDHENDTDAAIMEGLEVMALAKLGIANPY